MDTYDGIVACAQLFSIRELSTETSLGLLLGLCVFHGNGGHIVQVVKRLVVIDEWFMVNIRYTKYHSRITERFLQLVMKLVLMKDILFVAMKY